MDLSFNQVNYDKELDEFSEDELRELVSKFEDAQESNVAEFEKAVEATDDVDNDTIEDFEKAREDLIGDITEAEAFDEVPLSEDQLEDCDFGELRQWEDFVLESQTEDQEDEDFDDMGQKAPVGAGEDDADFADEVLENVPGLQVE